MMTAQELIDILEDADPETEIRLAIQPAWPFEHRVSGAEIVGDGEKDVVYLYEAGQIGYLPGDVTEAIGWRD